MAERTAIPIAPRKTLLEWIDDDDGDTTADPQRTASKAEQEFHARVVAGAGLGRADETEPLQPPAGLGLAPLG